MPAAPPTFEQDELQRQMGAGQQPPVNNMGLPPQTQDTGMASPQALGAGAGGAAPPALPAGAGGAAPQTAGAAQPWYTQGDIGTFQNWAQTRYGRQARPEELAQIGANSTDMASAQTYADTLARQQGWAGPAAPPPPPGPTVASNSAQLQQRIAEMLRTQTGDVNTNSQEYQSQRGAFQRGQGRQLERAKNAAAERAASSGTLASGGFEATQQGIDQAAAGQAGDFEAGLAVQQIGRQREDLQQAMQLAQQAGLATEARQLQEKLGQADLELRRYLGRGQLGLGMLGTLLNNQQAGNQLGFNYAQLQNQMNQQSLQQLLGGL